MRLAFSLFNYFPYGGLQRDFIRIARACRALGHSVDVFTMSWEGEAEPGLTLHLLPAKGMQNHSRRRHFADQFQKALEVDDFDLVVGFNKMPGLDVYYAADTCYQAKAAPKPRSALPFPGEWTLPVQRWRLKKRYLPAKILLKFH